MAELSGEEEAALAVVAGFLIGGQVAGPVGGLIGAGIAWKSVVD